MGAGMSLNTHHETLASTCGCDDPELVIERYWTAETHVGASKCLNCDRVIGMQVSSTNRIHHKRITLEDVLND